MSGNPFGTSAIKTGVTASTDTPLEGAAEVALVEPSDQGYFSPHAGYIEVGSKKILGVSSAQGFFYSEDLGEEAMKVMKDLEVRGLAYANQATSE